MSIETVVISRLRQRLEEERVRSMEKVSGGSGIEDFSLYRYAIGYHKGLDDCMKMLDDLLVELQTGDLH